MNYEVVNFPPCLKSSDRLSFVVISCHLLSLLVTSPGRRNSGAEVPGGNVKRRGGELQRLQHQGHPHTDR